jgi:hypothetical protein
LNPGRAALEDRMAYFKVYDVRVKFPTGGPVQVYMKTLNGGAPLAVPPATTPRVAAMLAVFNSGRDCYFDDINGVFATAPPPQFPGLSPGPFSKGVVSFWEIAIPSTGQIDLVLALISPAQKKQTSGSSATSWAVLHPTDADLGTFIELLNSRFHYYDNGTLQNTEISPP